MSFAGALLACLAVSALVALSTPRPALLVVVGVALLVTPGLVRTDVVARRLPNRLVAVLAAGTAAALALHLAAAPSAHVDVLRGVVSAVVVVVLGAVVAQWGGLGLGDVKLAAVLAASLPLTSSASMLVGTATLVVGSAAAVAATTVSGRHASSHRARGVPFGPVLLAAWWATVAAEALGTSAA